MGEQKAFDPVNTIRFFVDSDVLHNAEQCITACEACEPDLAEIPFDYVLDGLTGSDPRITDYVLPQPARCPRCGGDVLTGSWRWHTSQEEKVEVFILPGTLVTLKDDYFT